MPKCVKIEAVKTVKYLFITTTVLLFISCSTMGNRAASEVALETTRMLEQGQVDALTGSSGTPFLFETEVLPAPFQLARLWQALSDSGYDFGPQGEVEIFNPDEHTWKRFSSSRDVQVWFERHAPDKAALAVVPTSDGRLVIIIDRNRRLPGRLRGLKVEQER